MDKYFEYMISKISKIKDVKNVEIVINKGNYFDTINNLPPYCFRVTVSGGKDKKIAKKIYKLRPMGHFSLGNTCVTVKDSLGYEHTEYFERVAS